MHLSRFSLNNSNLFSHSNRVMGKYYGSGSGPTVVIFAGIHGNEKAGVNAVKNVVTWASNTGAKDLL